MKNNFVSKRISLILHRKAREDLLKSNIPKDINKWPESWRKRIYKEYPRFKSKKLEYEPELDNIPLDKILKQRKSTRSFNKKNQISFQTLSSLLYYSACDINNGSRRAYPSGGALYPLEIYVLVNNVNELDRGVYHLNIKQNSLEHIANVKELRESLKGLVSWAQDAPATICLGVRWGQNFQKYGDFGYRVIFAEAGHLSQNLQLVGESLGLNYCSFVALDEIAIEKALDLYDRGIESIIYATTIGY